MPSNPETADDGCCGGGVGPIPCPGCVDCPRNPLVADLIDKLNDAEMRRGTNERPTQTAPLVDRLWESDAASALTNEAAREIERLLAAIQQHAGKQRHTSLSTPADIELYEAAGL